MAAPKTVYTYDLDGANRDFPIPFEYLTRKFIQVTLLGQDRLPLVLNIDYRFTQRTVITTTKAYGPADGYERIELRRYTSATERLVDFNDGSILKAYDLNTSQIQALHIAEEGRDVATDTIGVDNDGNLDARGRRIVNLADATEDGHAVTLRQEREWAASTLGNRNASQVSAQASEASAVRSDASRAESLRQAGLSKVSADASEVSRLDAANSARIATEEIAKIDGQVLVAKGHADRSKTEADRSAERAASSGASATRSLNSENAAKVAENSALNSAKNAADAGIQLGMAAWGFRWKPFNGFALDDGQELDRAVYPDFAAALDRGDFPVTSEALWQSNPLMRSYFVANSSTGKFRMRDLNGKSVGTAGAVFLRGSPAENAGIVKDQLQRFTFGSPTSPTYKLCQLTNAYPNGANAGTPYKGVYMAVPGVGDMAAINMADDGVGGTPRVGLETFPTHAKAAWMTRLFGVITPLGTAEAASLATAYGSLAARVGTLETQFAAQTARVLKAPLWEKVLLSAIAWGNGTVGTLSDDAFNYEMFSGNYAGGGVMMHMHGMGQLCAEPVQTSVYLTASPNQYIYAKFNDTVPGQRRVLNTIQFAANSGFTNLYGWRRVGYQP